MQKSIFWTTGTTGDGASTYTQAELFAWMKRTLLGAPASEGVLKGYAGDLAVTGTSSPLSVAAGAAVVNGIPYENDAPVDVAVPTPLVGTTGFRVVLRADYTAQTVRIALKTSQDGVATVPALDQADGTIWEISLATGTITTGGVIELTDARSYAHFRTAVDTSMLDNGSVTGAKLASGAAAANIDNGAITSAMLANNAVTSTKIAGGAVTLPKIAANSVTTDRIVDDAVDDTKVGARVPQFYRRQGGSSSNWSAGGTNNYTPGAVRMQAGVYNLGPLTQGTVITVDITFPQAFSAPPVIYAVTNDWQIRLDSTELITATGFRFTARGIMTSGSVAAEVRWLAIGPE